MLMMGKQNDQQQCPPGPIFVIILLHKRVLRIFVNVLDNITSLTYRQLLSELLC